MGYLPIFPLYFNEDIAPTLIHGAAKFIHTDAGLQIIAMNFFHQLFTIKNPPIGLVLHITQRKQQIFGEFGQKIKFNISQLCRFSPL